MSATEPVQVDHSHFVDPGRSHALLAGFSALYDQHRFTDISLIVKGHEFEAHRSLLAASSPYFMAMFTVDLAERGQKRVLINQMQPTTMKLVLDYIYRGEVELCEDTVQCLLSAANLFQMEALRDGCASFMTDHVTKNNCIGVYFFAKAHSCESLAGKAQDMMHCNFTSLSKEQEFLLLPAEQLVEVLKDDRLDVKLEEQVYEAALSWLHYDREHRSKYISNVLSCVRFANISSYYLCDHVDTNKMIEKQPEIQKMLNQVKYYHMLRHRQNELDLNRVPRQGMQTVQGVLVIANPYHEDSNKKSNSMELLIPNTGKIHYISKLPHNVYMPGTCLTGDNQIYLAGGALRKNNYRGPYATDGVSPSLYVYDKKFGTWQVRARMLNPRSQFAFTLVDGLLYVTGGQSESTVLQSVESYDPFLDKWQARTQMPKPLRRMTALAYRGKLYMFGGETETEITNSVYRFDPGDDSWLELPSMHVPRALAGCTVYEDKFYIVGGNSSMSLKWRKELLPEHCVNAVEIFDPATNSWSFGPDLPNALCGAGVMKYGGSLIVVGGEDDKSWMAGLYRLTKESDGEQKWTEGHELSTVMSTFGSVIGDLPKSLVPED